MQKNFSATVFFFTTKSQDKSQLVVSQNLYIGSPSKLMMAKTNSLSPALTKREYAKMKDGCLQQNRFLKPFEFECEEQIIKGCQFSEVIPLCHGNIMVKVLCRRSLFVVCYKYQSVFASSWDFVFVEF